MSGSCRLCSLEMGSVPPIRLRGDIEVNVQHHRSDITDAQTADDRERHQRGLARSRRNVKHTPPRPYLSGSKHRWDKEARPLATQWSPTGCHVQGPDPKFVRITGPTRLTVPYRRQKAVVHQR